ncbi:hypothetical protein, partial [Heyndrickxia coagulans]|uniref:hypothetical protein n=1 Tax=Heyndrickxia coagulans TaxID=1398 RepID=UPI001BE40CDF
NDHARDNRHVFPLQVPMATPLFSFFSFIIKDKRSFFKWILQIWSGILLLHISYQFIVTNKALHD